MNALNNVRKVASLLLIVTAAGLLAVTARS